MAVSTIDRVRAAELEAYDMQNEAEQKAEQLLTDAQRRADEIIADAKKRVDAADKAACGEADAKAASMVSERREAAQTRADALEEKTLKLKQNVINKLIEETLV